MNSSFFIIPNIEYYISGLEPPSFNLKKLGQDVCSRKCDVEMMDTSDRAMKKLCKGSPDTR